MIALRQRIKEQTFAKELGYLWGTLEEVKYEDPSMALPFYNALFLLAQSQALFKIDANLMREVQTRILRPAKDLITDFLSLRAVKETGSVRLEGPADDISMLLFNYDQIAVFVDGFLKSSK